MTSDSLNRKIDVGDYIAYAVNSQGHSLMRFGKVAGFSQPLRHQVTDKSILVSAAVRCWDGSGYEPAAIRQRVDPAKCIVLFGEDVPKELRDALNPARN